MLLTLSGLAVLGLELSNALASRRNPLYHLYVLHVDTLSLELAIVAVLIGGLIAISGRFRVGTSVGIALLTLLGGVNVLKVLYREEPLYPSDFAFISEAALLTDSIRTYEVAALVSASVGAGAFVWLVTSRVHRPAVLMPASRRNEMVLRVAGVLAAGGLALASTLFNAPTPNPLRGVVEAVGTKWTPWSQGQNYVRNGFVPGFLYNMPVAAMEEPDGYSEEEIERLVTSYADLAEEMNRDRDASALSDHNVVIILAESFFDPLTVRGLSVAEDPIPHFRALAQHYPSGTMRSVAYGGGTAHVEFEVLTGMSISEFAPQMQTPYQSMVSRQSSFPSLVSRLGETHTTLAIHPNTPHFYRRGDAFRAFGFDTSVFKDGMTAKGTLGDSKLISDAAAYTDLVRHLRAEQRPVLAPTCV